MIFRGTKFTHDYSGFTQETPSDEAAFFVGLLMTDGCVSNGRSNSPSVTSIKLHHEDEDVLEKLKRFLRYDGPVIRRDANPNRIVNGKYKESDSVSLRFHGVGLASSLISAGVVPRKTLTAKASEKYASMPGFWRGAICGDGNISQRRGNDWSLCFCSSSAGLVSQYAKYCESVGISSSIKVSTPNWMTKNPNYRVTHYAKNAYRIIKSCFHEGFVCMDRKMNMAKEIASWYESPAAYFCKKCGEEKSVVRIELKHKETVKCSRCRTACATGSANLFGCTPTLLNNPPYGYPYVPPNAGPFSQ